MDGQMTPAMGPTAWWWWQGSSSICPDSTRARAFRLVLCFAFEDQRPGDRAAHRSGGPLPGDGRSSVQQQILAHTGDYVPGFAHAHDDRAGFHHSLCRFGICFFYIHRTFLSWIWNERTCEDLSLLFLIISNGVIFLESASRARTENAPLSGSPRKAPGCDLPDDQSSGGSYYPR